MQTNNMLELARETRKKIRKVFTDKVDTITAYDIVDEPKRHTFKLNFRVYNFAGVKFQYENDLFEIYVFSTVMRVYCCLRKIVITVK